MSNQIDYRDLVQPENKVIEGIGGLQRDTKEYAIIDGQRVELTPWLDSTVMPVHDGVYETGYGFRLFQAGSWHYRADTVAEAVTGLPQVGWTPAGGKWRGLAHPQGAV